MSQIRIVSINREKDRFLVCPFVMSWGINRVTDRFFRSLKSPGVTAGDVAWRCWTRSRSSSARARSS